MRHLPCGFLRSRSKHVTKMAMDKKSRIRRRDGWRDPLIDWFDAHARDLPWRRNHDPYQVWLSEVMLQQTQVDRVADYFVRWLELFPDVASVARADIDRILSIWQGLGYYSRARNFHAAAQKVVDEYGGKVPHEYDALLSLPGVGRYTAGAVMSFAFNEPYPTLEANTERVYARLYDLADPIKRPAVFRRVESRLASLIPEGQARAFNQGLMELGSLVCLPSSPHCDRCPVARWCLARQRDTISERPILPARKERIEVELAAAVIVRAGRFFVRRRPNRGLWAGFWEFPTAVIEPGQTPEGAARQAVENRMLPRAEKLATVRHSFTRFRATLHCYLFNLDKGTPVHGDPDLERSGRSVFRATEPGDEQTPVAASDESAAWVDFDQLSELPMNAGHRRCLRTLAEWLDGHVDSTRQSFVAASHHPLSEDPR